MVGFCVCGGGGGRSNAGGKKWVSSGVGTGGSWVRASRHPSPPIPLFPCSHPPPCPPPYALFLPNTSHVLHTLCRHSLCQAHQGRAGEEPPLPRHAAQAQVLQPSEACYRGQGPRQARLYGQRQAAGECGGVQQPKVLAGAITLRRSPQGGRRWAWCRWRVRVGVDQ